MVSAKTITKRLDESMANLSRMLEEKKVGKNETTRRRIANYIHVSLFEIAGDLAVGNPVDYQKKIWSLIGDTTEREAPKTGCRKINSIATAVSMDFERIAKHCDSFAKDYNTPIMNPDTYVPVTPSNLTGLTIFGIDNPRRSNILLEVLMHDR